MVNLDFLHNTYGQLIFGSGNHRKKGITFIADMPGKQEILSGIPFTGTSGKLLDSHLSSINLCRDSIYFTNVIKVRLLNRQPNQKDILNFTPLLIQELTDLDPKIVVSLGSLSLQTFLPHMKISEIHGQSFKITWQNLSFILMPLYHPAAALHNGKMRPILMQDFFNLRVLLQKHNLLSD